MEIDAIVERDVEERREINPTFFLFYVHLLCRVDRDDSPITLLGSVCC